MPKDYSAFEKEIQLLTGKLILSNLAGQRELARAIFNALVPHIQTMDYYNQHLKILTQLTLGAAGDEDDRLDFHSGERPRLKTEHNRPPSLPDALSDLSEKLENE